MNQTLGAPEPTSVPPELTERLGGPVGRHARRTGVWFNPAVWAVLVAGLGWLVTIWQHKPCQQHVAGNTVNTFTRFCYSDIPVAYQNTSLGTGASPLRLTYQNWPPLTGVFIWLVQRVSALFGADLTAPSAQQVVDGASVFLLVAAVLLFVCLLVIVACTLLMGRDSATSMATTVAGRVRSWDVMFVAACPLVVASGLVSWDLFAVALCTAALFAWAIDSRVACGVLFGLAITAGVWPVLVLMAIGILCVRARRVGPFAFVAGLALVTVLAVSAAVLVLFGHPWTGVVDGWTSRDAGLGSIWFILKELKVTFSSQVLSFAVIAFFAAWVGWVVLLATQVAPRRPRVGQVAFLLVAGWLVVNKVYSPQQVLWLVPLVMLARPKLADWGTWVVAELIYWAAVWGHLGTMSSPGDGGPDVVYWAAIGFRIVVLVWLCAQVSHDMRHPWDDPVRTPQVDDPIGGILDHAPERPVSDDFRDDDRDEAPHRLIAEVAR